MIDVRAQTTNEVWSGTLGSTITVTANVLAGSILCVGVTYDFSNGTTSATVTDSLNPGIYTPGAIANDNTDTQRMSVFFMTNSRGGSNTVTATMNGAQAGFRGIWLIEITGGSAFDGSIANVISSPGTVADALTSTTPTPVANASPALVVGFGCNFSVAPGIPAAGTGFTTDGTTAFGGSARSEWKRVTSTAGRAATFTATSSSGVGVQSATSIVFDEAGNASMFAVF